MDKSTKPFSLTQLLSFVNNNFALLLVAGLLFAGGFFSGSLWTENSMLKSGTTPTAAVPAAADPNAALPTGPTADQLAAVPAVEDGDYIRGNRNAKIKLVEYSDFECPFCARFHPTVQQIMAEYGDDVAWVYRDYPLSFHPNAQKAAEASHCVAEQGGDEAFWKYADKIFEENLKNGAITPATFDLGAQAAGVNMQTFKTCLDSGKMAQRVTDALNEGTAAGVTGTPGTFIVTEDGAQEMISGAYPLEQVKPMIEKYL